MSYHPTTPAQKRVHTVHIGLIGLGKMGFNMRERLRKGGIEVTGFDRNPDVTDVATVDELIAAVPAPRMIWVMVPVRRHHRRRDHRTRQQARRR